MFGNFVINKSKVSKMPGFSLVMLANKSVTTEMEGDHVTGCQVTVIMALVLT